MTGKSSRTRGAASREAASGHELAMALRIAYLTMHRQANAELSDFALTADQFVVLRTLADADGVTQKELVRRTGSDANTMSEKLARLEARGFITRERAATDGRARSVTLTGEGRRQYERAWKESQGFRERLMTLFKPEERDIFVDFLNRIANAMASA